MAWNPQAQDTLAAYREATRQMDYVYSMFSRSCGLSEAEYWSLLLIYEGVGTQSEISERLFFSRQTLNSAFKLLKKKGLIRLEPMEENLRSKQTFLTEEGRAFVEKFVVQMHKIEEKAWEQMGEEERRLLTSLTQKMGSLILQELKNQEKTEN